MRKYRYMLEKGSRKHLCPACGKLRFVRYIDSATSEYMPEQYGRCDRQDNCGYHCNPYDDGYKKDDLGRLESPKLSRPDPVPNYYMPEDILNLTLGNYDKNIFIQNLFRLVPEKEDIERITALYRLGTIGKGYRKGAVTFPFIDLSGNIQAIQAKQFNDSNHTVSTDWVHSILSRYYHEKGGAWPEWLVKYSRNETKVNCLFGEHLLRKFPLNPVALVEAPKTAVVATLYYGLPDDPSQLLWLAVYNKSSLTHEKCKALKGRKVVLYPDLNAYNQWNEKIVKIRQNMPGTYFTVSDLLEQNATEEDKQKGLDLADYLSRFDYKPFRQNTRNNRNSSRVIRSHLKNTL